MNALLYPPLPLLLVDDEKAWLRSLSLTLKSEGGLTNLLLCEDSRQVLEILAEREVGAVLLDLNMPFLSGEELLPEIIANHPEVPVIIISGMNQIETAVRCIKEGAFDYFVKAVEVDRLIAGIHRALKLQKLNRDNRAMSERLMQEGPEHPEAFADLVTRSPKMLGIFKYVEAIAGSSGPVLITGESGTGKELIARALHRLGREKGPWLTLNAAGMGLEELTLTLFGDPVRGRTGLLERGRQGTVFLDEIGGICPEFQGRLLRLTQGEDSSAGWAPKGPQPARLLFATNQNLEARVENGQFRRDLYYRLRQNHVHLPPLRERLEDMPLLLDHFLAEAAEALGKRKPTPPPELVTLLSTYAFPGNIRELRMMVYRAVIAHGSRKLAMGIFREEIARAGSLPPGAAAEQGLAPPPLVFPGILPTLSEAANLLVDEAMRRAKGNQSVAAGLLGITRQALNQRLRNRG